MVEYPLPACCVTIAVTRDARLNVVIRDLSIKHGLDASFISHLRIHALFSGLDELGKPNAEHVGGYVILGCHLVMSKLRKLTRIARDDRQMKAVMVLQY